MPEVVLTQTPNSSGRVIFIIIDEKTFELHRNEITEKHNINSIDPNEHKGTDVYPSLFYYLK